jgi:hypothetical protein
MGFPSREPDFVQKEIGNHEELLSRGITDEPGV